MKNASKSFEIPVHRRNPYLWAKNQRGNEVQGSFNLYRIYLFCSLFFFLKFLMTKFFLRKIQAQYTYYFTIKNLKNMSPLFTDDVLVISTKRVGVKIKFNEWYMKNTILIADLMKVLWKMITNLSLAHIIEIAEPKAKRLHFSKVRGESASLC